MEISSADLNMESTYVDLAQLAIDYLGQRAPGCQLWIGIAGGPGVVSRVFEIPKHNYSLTGDDV